MPFLHNRKLFLNRQKKNTEYFYTSIETLTQDVNDHSVNNQQDQQSQTYFEIDDHNDDAYQKLCNGTNAIEEPKFTSIICINLTEYKFYVYSLQGLLIKRYEFDNEIEDHGVPVSVSNNGLNFIFKKTPLQLAKSLMSQTISNHDSMTIMRMDIFGFHFIKKIPYFERIRLNSLVNSQ